MCRLCNAELGIAIRLDDVRDAQLPKFDDVKPQIAQQLLQQKMAKYQEELRAKAKIE